MNKTRLKQLIKECVNEVLNENLRDNILNELVFARKSLGEMKFYSICSCNCKN